MNENRNQRKLLFVKNYRILFRFSIIISLLFWFAISCDSTSDDNDILSTTPECAIPEEGKRSFWVANLETSLYDCIQSELKGEGSGTTSDGTSWSYKVYVDTEDSNVESTVSESILTAIKTKLDKIVPKTISVFGTPPQPSFLVESAIIFFITDIKDNQGDESYVAGFFDSIHLSATSSRSNRVNMLVFEYMPLKDSENFPDFYNTLAHELQHLIHYSHDQLEETWLDEGLAEMSSAINQDTTGRSLFDPDDGETCADFNKTFYNCEISSIDPSSISLLLWEGDTKHYWKTALFFKYLCEKEGDNCEKTLYDIVSSTKKGMSSVEAALSTSESQSALGKNISDFSALQTNHSNTEYENFTAIYQSWLVAMSKVAYNNAMGVSIDKNSLDDRLEKHRYITFSRSYPYWKSYELTSSNAIVYDSFLPFSAVYIDWSVPRHGNNAFENNGFEKIRIITIATDGTVNFSPSNNLTGFNGMEIVYNINPFYELSEPSATGAQTVTNTDSLGNTVDINVTAKIQTSVDQDYSEGINNITGYLISIGNLPFNEISVRNLETGKTYALSGEPVKDLAQNLGKQVSVTGFLSSELSRRNQEIFEVISFEFL